MDADGKYTWGLFRGSRYWLGSADLCRELDRDVEESGKFMDGNEKESLEIPPFRIDVNSVSLKIDVLKAGLNGVSILRSHVLNISLFMTNIWFRPIIID